MISLIKRLLWSKDVPKGKEIQTTEIISEPRILLPESLPNVSTGGLTVIAMVGDYDRSRLPVSNDEIVLCSESGEKITSQCGHASHAELVFDVYGLKIEGKGQLTCPECSIKELREITIRCALCGLPILPGDGVSIYDIGGRDIRADIAFKVGEHQVLGCNGMDCSIPGAYAGLWGGPQRGFVSAFE